MKFLALVLLMGLAASAQTKSQPASTEYPNPLIREEQTVVINGVTETWRLQWKAVPKPYCEADAKFGDWVTCPCNGFAFGEAGDLFLVRLRDGSEIERLRLTPLFKMTEGEAVVRQRPTEQNDLELSKGSDFLAMVSKRPVVQLIHFEDYDHDGSATEFYLQTDAGSPCGHTAGVVIGVSKKNPRLHVFGTASHPAKPLYMEPHEWKALRAAPSGPIDVIHVQCGDHGAETDVDLRLNWSENGIDGSIREYTCPPFTHHKRRLISQRPLSMLEPVNW